jgi:hypothetical protein
MTIHSSTTIKWDNLQVKDANWIKGVVGATGPIGETGFNNFMPYKISNAEYIIPNKSNETYEIHGFVTIPNAQTTITMSTVQYYTSTGNPLYISNKSYLLLLRIA